MLVQVSERRHWHCHPANTIQHSHEQYWSRIGLKKHMVSKTAHDSQAPSTTGGHHVPSCAYTEGGSVGGMEERKLNRNNSNACKARCQQALSIPTKYQQGGGAMISGLHTIKKRFERLSKLLKIIGSSGSNAGALFPKADTVWPSNQGIHTQIHSLGRVSF